MAQFYFSRHKQGDLFNIFNPEIQIQVDEWVWKLRKYINKKYFS